MEIYTVKFANKLDNNEFEYLLKFVSLEKQNRIRRYRRWQDAHRGLFAELLIRHIIIKFSDLENEKITFSYNKYNKPLFSDINSFHFSLSHSGDWIVCAVDFMPVGIDVEKIEPIDFDISKRYFSKKEQSDLLSKEGEAKLNYFFDLWTLKESYIKAKGKGLRIPLKSFTLKARTMDDITFKSEEYPNEKNKFFKQYPLDKNYKLSICAQNKIFPPNPVILEVNELISTFKKYEMIG